LRHRRSSHRSSSRLRRASWTISTRLFCLVLVPLLLAFGVSSLTVSAAHDAVSRAQKIKNAVPEIDALLHLQAAVNDETSAEVVGSFAKRFRFDPNALAKSIGRSSNAATSQREVGQSLVKVVGYFPDDVHPFERDLVTARAYVARPDATAAGIGATFARLGADVMELQGQATSRLIKETRKLDGSDQMVAALTALSDLGQAQQYRTVQLLEVGNLVLAGGVPATSGLTAVARSTALYQEAESSLRSSAVPAVAKLWQTAARDPSSRLVDALVASFLSGQGAGTGNPLNVAISYAPLLSQILSDTTRAADRALTDGANAAAHRAGVTQWGTLVLWVLCLVGVTAFALRASRSIGNPLRELAKHAREISSGTLDASQARIRGPQEVRDVSRAFRELTSNLKLLEAKTLALANMDMTSSALATTLPGQLGSAIDRSVQILSESVAERERLGRQLAHQATHDPLTGMPNRAAALSAAQGALSRGARSGSPVAMLFLDLDSFKQVNDYLGHQVGDELLIEVCRRMTQVVRAGDLVARLGGDEFIVVAEATDAAQAVLLGERLIEAIAVPMTLATYQVNCGASVGVALALDGAVEIEDFLHRADVALYRAKDAGRGRVQLFDVSLQQELNHKTEIEAQLRATLGRGGDELELDFQPVFDGATGQVRSAEALVRWNRPGLGRVQPDSFIPIAELTSLIIDLDRWVLRRAVEEATRWQQRPGLAGVSVAVNISGRHLLSGKLSGHVDAVLAETGLSPQNLILEITETVVISDLALASTYLERIRQTGVRVAIDDFGTGYTSLAALRSLPVDIVKIDRSFVAQMDQQSNRSLVGLVTQLTHEMGATVVAEGVETADQLATVRDLGGDQVQGFLVGRPGPVEGLANLVAGTVPAPR
jgi:diguanylate cyclase (GGDEF)-like protein